MMIGTIKCWTGDLAILEHLDRYGSLDLAEQLMDEDAAGIERESISADEMRELLRLAVGPS